MLWTFIFSLYILFTAPAAKVDFDCRLVGNFQTGEITKVCTLQPAPERNERERPPKDRNREDS